MLSADGHAGFWRKQETERRGAAVTWSYKAAAETPADVCSNVSGTCTATGVAIGTTSSGDVVVLIVGSDGTAPTGVTVADVGSNVRSMSKLTEDNTGVSNMSMWYMTGFALGSTTTVAVSGGSSNPGWTAV